MSRAGREPAAKSKASREPEAKHDAPTSAGSASIDNLTAAREARERQAPADSGAGRALEPGVRGDMERLFGHDLGGVRVHTDGAAAGHAESLGAEAFTVGRHVFFSPGAYRPDDPAGRRTLAHEVAHALQQAGNPDGATTQRSRPGDASEREADRAASAVAAGKSAGALSSTPLQLACAPKIKTGDLASAADWSYVAYMEQGLIRLRFCSGKDCEAKDNAVGTIGWVTNNPSNLDVSDDPAQVAARTPRTEGKAYQTSETEFDANNRFKRFAIFSDASEGWAAMIPYWKALATSSSSLGGVIKKHKGLEPGEKARLDKIEADAIQKAKDENKTDDEAKRAGAAARQAADPREKELKLTRGFLIDIFKENDPTLSDADASKMADETLNRQFSDYLLTGPDANWNAVLLFLLMSVMQAVGRVEGTLKPSGVIYRCATDAYEHDDISRYSPKNQTRINDLKASAAVRDELRRILGCP